MARLFGFIANRPDILSRIAAHEARLLLEANPGKSLGWGIGFYQGGEVLLRRRPVDDRPVVDLSIALSDVRTDVAIGHVRRWHGPARDTGYDGRQQQMGRSVHS